MKLYTTLSLIALLSSCNAAEMTHSNAPGAEATVDSELSKSKPSLAGWSTFGFCNELKEVLTVDVATMKGTIACFDSYGIDGAAFWGYTRAGHTGQPTSQVSAVVNGQTVGLMDVTMRGSSAERLFEAMSTDFSENLPSTERRSSSDRIHCTHPGETDSARCTITGLVGFDSPSTFF